MSVFAMGGYEVYVWGSVGLGVLTFAWNLLAPAWQRRALLKRLEQLDDEEDR